MTDKITKEMMLGDLVTKYPKAAEILMEKGIHCIGCMAAKFETIGQGLQAHGLQKKDIDEILKKMNDAVK